VNSLIESNKQTNNSKDRIHIPFNQFKPGLIESRFKIQTL
jgi:hypothetical protein